MTGAAGGFQRYSVVVALADWACPDIAHYNFSASSEVVGSPEGLGVAPSHLGRCPKNPARTFSPVQPDQRVTFSLETPLSGFHP